MYCGEQASAWHSSSCLSTTPDRPSTRSLRPSLSFQRFCQSGLVAKVLLVSFNLLRSSTTLRRETTRLLSAPRLRILQQLALWLLRFTPSALPSHSSSGVSGLSGSCWQYRVSSTFGSSPSFRSIWVSGVWSSLSAPWPLPPSSSDPSLILAHLE